MIFNAYIRQTVILTEHEVAEIFFRMILEVINTGGKEVIFYDE